MGTQRSNNGGSWQTIGVMALAVSLLLLPGMAFAGNGGAPGGSEQHSEVREAIRNDGRAAVIISFDVEGQPRPGSAAPVDLDELRRNVSAAQRGLLASIDGLKVRHRFAVVPALSAELTSERALDRIARHPSVADIDLDLGGTGTLGDSVPFIGADVRQALGNDGEGVTVAVMDTGADTDHPDLDDDIGTVQACFGDNNGSIDGTGFCPNASDRQTGDGAAEDDAGHGTHVSGIITSKGTVSSPGTAPGADIVPIKVLDNCTFAGCFYAFSEIVAAWDWIIDNDDTLGIDVINMSLGTGAQYAGVCDTNFSAGAAAVSTLRSLGIIPFASAGNNGGNQMGAPACITGVVAVGATNNADNVAGFSDSNATTDIFAPGVGVVSLAIGGGTTTASGTSMASPHAAGCAALLIEAGDATTPDAVENRLETSPFQVTDSNGLTFPRIDCRPDGSGTIVIEKKTVPAGREGFSFTDDIEAPNAFDLDGEQQKTFTGVVPGFYTVTESVPPAFFDLTGLECDDPNSASTTNLATRTAEIELRAGETVTCTFTNSDAAPTVSAAPASQTVQYSDGTQDVTVTASDSVQDALSASTSYSTDGSGFVAGLPDGLALTSGGCSSSGDTQTCTWTIGGDIDEPAGTYVVRTTVTDDDGTATSADVTVVVGPEDATAGFAGDNPVAVEVDAPGGDSGPFTLTLTVEETEPDLPFATAAPGSISKAVVEVDLMPVGPGSPVVGSCAPAGVTGTGYDQVLTVDCTFEDVPVNTYTVAASVVGGFYTGSAEDVLTVYDPSLGFTTGGGWFSWPDTGERTNFGYTIKYNKAGKNLVGSLLIIRHMDDGSTYRVKGNALDGLAVGDGDGFDWASFSGKATYREPGWIDAQGNHAFTVYVEDHGVPGGDADRFWIEVRDKDGAVVTAFSIGGSAADDAVTIAKGDIVVPHTTGKGKKPS